jgi:uncharacterized protein (TIGR03437 family)
MWSRNKLITQAVVSLGSVLRGNTHTRRWINTRSAIGITLLTISFFGFYQGQHVQAVGETNSRAAGVARRDESFGRLPLYFIENRGQMDRRVAFYLQGRDKTIFFTPSGVTLSLTGAAETKAGSRWNLKLDFLGANPQVKIEGLAAAEASFSYFRGARDQWRTGLPAYRDIIYRDLWPGIDLVYAGTVERMKYSFVVKPGADPGRIRLAYRGASRVAINPAGELEVQTPNGNYRDESPVSWQENVAGRRDVHTSYRLAANTAENVVSYGFELGEYDRNKELIIDPAVLIYCGFIGGSADESGNDIAVDRSGNAYVVGETSSSEATFPDTVGPDSTFGGGGTDAFIAKINPTGSGLVYCGYIGGTNGDLARGVAVDADGNAYVVGETFSNQNSFPVVGGPDQTFNAGSTDAFITKLNASGTGLIYSGYIGGNRRDFGQKVAVDSSGNAFIVGYTESAEDTFPVTVGPSLVHSGKIDAFVTKVNAAGNLLIYCGYIGGVEQDYGRDIAIDSTGNAYLTGDTASDQNTFPVTAGSADGIYNGGLNDAYVAKVNANGSALIYCSYLGGTGSDVGHGIGVDSASAAYISGETTSDQGSFPVLLGPDLTFNGMTDAFVTKINASGAGLVFSGYIGGTGFDRSLCLAVDGSGNVHVAGETSSFQTSFPVIGGPQLRTNGVVDAFVAKLNGATSALIYAGYLGGVANDFAFSIAVDIDERAYVTGYTESNQQTFPVLSGPDLTFNGGKTDAFVAKIERQPDTTPPTIASVGSITRGQGANNSATLAFVSDVDTLPGNIFIALRGVPAGVQVTSLTNNNGEVTANFNVACNAVPGTFTINVEAIDSAGLFSSSPVTLTIAPNTAPQLPIYTNTEVVLAGSTTITPAIPPSDNGVIATATATAPGFTGTLLVNPATGVISVANAGPAGLFNVTVNATDNCGVAATRSFRLLVGAVAATVNAASFSGTTVSRESIAAIFGTELATATQIGGTVPLPTTLAGTTVRVIDSAGADRLAPLFFVSPGQINFLVPAGTANGEASVIVRNSEGKVSVDRLNVVAVAPGIFSANASGSGIAAAQVLRVKANGTQIFEPVARFDQQAMAFVPVPIDFGDPTDTLFLVLYGTGFKFSGGFSVTTVIVGGTSLTVTYAGEAFGFVGLDQINAALPRSLAGRGEVDVVVTIQGQAANTVRLAFR